MKERGYPLSWKEGTTGHSGETGGSDAKILDAFPGVLVTKVPGETVFNYIVNRSGDGWLQRRRTYRHCGDNNVGKVFRGAQHIL